MRRFLLFPIGLSFLSVIVAGNFYLVVMPPETSPIITSLRTEALPTIANEISPSKSDQALLLVQSQSRPLFSPTRRPWVAPDLEPVPESVSAAVQPVAIEPAVAIDIQPPNVALIGIQKTPDGAKALLLKTGTAEAVWFKSGEQIDGWTVAAVENTTVELANGNQKIKLELYPNSTPPALPTQPVQP